MMLQAGRFSELGWDNVDGFCRLDKTAQKAFSGEVKEGRDLKM
jgi:hypothetical protein